MRYVLLVLLSATAFGLRADISGPENIPDGIVNFCDLSVLASEWLRTGDMSVDLSANRVVHYKMNDTSSTTVVDSAGTSNGTSQRDTSLMTASGLINTALDFDGTNDWIDCNDPLESTFQNSFSVALWVKPDDGDIGINSQDIFGTYATAQANSMFLLFHSDISLYLDYKVADIPLFPGPIYLTAAAVFSDGQEDWHLIVATMEQSGSNVIGCLYVDNVLKATDTQAMDMSDFAGAGNPYIGQANVDAGGPSVGFEFAGAIDNVIVFNKVLSSEERAFLYNAGSGTEELTNAGGMSPAFIEMMYE